MDRYPHSEEVKDNLLQLVVGLREKIYIDWGLREIGYTAGMSDGILDLLRLEISGDPRIPPFFPRDLGEINSRQDTPAWIVLRISTNEKKLIMNFYKHTHRGMRDFILSTLRKCLYYGIDGAGEIYQTPPEGEISKPKTKKDGGDVWKSM